MPNLRVRDGLCLLVLVSITIAIVFLELGQRHEFEDYGYDNLDYGIPGLSDLLIQREGYALGYNGLWKQAAWVSYRLTANEVLSNACKRTNSFAKDPDIESDFSLPQDYAASGYDRGHLAPAADMRWSRKSLMESFFMSNMSPQKPAFNRGIWSTLEQWVRDTAVLETNIVIVTGPIVCSNDLANTIGRRKVVVPSAYYKVIYDETPPVKMIAFLLPNEGSSLAISNFVVTVDSVENATGLDFFPLLPDRTENALEASVSIQSWKWVGSH